MRRGPELSGRTVVLLGGTAGIGLATARLARAAGADVVLTGRLQAAADQLWPVATATFDATDLAVHLMADEALTGATFDVDGGKQLV